MSESYITAHSQLFSLITLGYPANHIYMSRMYTVKRNVEHNMPIGARSLVL